MPRSSSSEPTLRPVSIVPPSERRCDASASGEPLRAAARRAASRPRGRASPSISPNAAVGGCVRAAASSARRARRRSARARSPRNASARERRRRQRGARGRSARARADGADGRAARAGPPHERVASRRERRDQPRVAAAQSSPSVAPVAATSRSSSRRCPVVERVGERRTATGSTRRRARASGSVRRNGERDAERMDRRAHVVHGTRAASARPTACRRRRVSARLEHAHRHARPRQRDRRGQPVRPGADDDRIRHSRSLNAAGAGQLAKRRGRGVEPRLERAVVPHVPGARPLAATLDADDASSPAPRREPSRAASALHRRTPERILLAVPAQRQPELGQGSCARISTCALRDGRPVLPRTR